MLTYLKPYIIIMVATVVLNHPSLSQSSFLEKGENGSLLALGLAKSNKTFAVTGIVAFSFRGIFDTRFRIGSLSKPAALQSTTTYSITFELQALRKYSPAQLSLSLGTGASHSSHVPDAYTYDEGVSTTALPFFGKLYRNFVLSNLVLLQPAYELRYVLDVSNDQVQYGDSYSMGRIYKTQRPLPGIPNLWLHTFALATSLHTLTQKQILFSITGEFSNTSPLWGIELGTML